MALRDETGGDADGWKVFNASTQCEGSIGWFTVIRPVGRFKAGDKVPFGQYYTECIIDTRDKILSDSAINLPIPAATDTISEKESLDICLDAVTSSMGAAYKELYYPAASYCYAYEPDVKNLADKFKAHNWWAASYGELIRAYFYYNQSKDPDKANNPFNVYEKGIQLGLFDSWINTYEFTSSENSGNIIRSYGPIGYYSKYDLIQASNKAKNTTGYIRPLCKF